MSENKHTPGPWDKVVELLSEWELKALTVTDCGGDFIPPHEEDDECYCSGCKFHALCASNVKRSDELAAAVAKAKDGK